MRFLSHLPLENPELLQTATTRRAACFSCFDPIKSLREHSTLRRRPIVPRKATCNLASFLIVRGPEVWAGQEDLTGKSLLAYHTAVSDVFEALSSPVRRTILDELQSKDGQTLFELCSRLTMKHGLGLSRQAISQHLDVLESAGLVATKRAGRYKFHYLDTRPLGSIYERWPTRP
jgi:DNA-binding transcriptional ArsR family regulator